MNCIFCKCATKESSVEHILPESLGGKDWACLPPGFVCTSCNQYFGSKVEPNALGSFPFLPLRLILGIPTKSKRPARMNSHLGILKGSPYPGTIGIDPINQDIEQAIFDGRVSQFRILAEPTDTVSVVRLLLKMGLETLALSSYEEARSSTFDAARSFARAPKRRSKWWFMIHTDQSLFSTMTVGVSHEEWCNGVALEVSEIENVPSFILRFLGMTLITSLIETVLDPSMRQLPGPEYQVFEAVV